MRRIGIFCVLSLLMVAAVGRAAPLTRPSRSASTDGLRLRIASPSSSATSRRPSIREARGPSLEADRVVSARLRTAGDSVLLGNQTIQRMVGRISAGRAEAFPFAVRRPGRVSRISVYVDPHNRAKKLIVGLYSSRPGGPLRRLTSGTRASLKAGSWNTVRVRTATVRSRRTYWIAVLGRGGMLYFRDHKQGSCQSEMSGGFSLGSVPLSWANGTRRNACPISAYATGRPTTTLTFGTLTPPPPAPAGATPPLPSACPSATPNTPDGPDRWGGCFPGPRTSGVPSNVALVDVTGGAIQPPNAALPSDNAGWTNSNGTLTAHLGQRRCRRRFRGRCERVDGMGGTVMDSSLDHHVNFSSSGALTIENTTIYGGSNTNWDAIDNFDRGTLLVDGDEISGGGHGVLCYSNCTIENTYINNIAASDGAHQNPILFDGGSNNSVTHSTVHCTASNTCTSELSLLLNDGEQVNETMAKNLIMSTTPGHAAYCVYPGPNYSSAPHQVSGITWEDNVLQKGSDGHCDSSYGEVYAWHPATCSPNPCTWTGNVYDDGTVWNP